MENGEEESCIQDNSEEASEGIEEDKCVASASSVH
jgi:hypothetical protein